MRGAGNRRPLDDVQADAAAAEHRDARARYHARRVEYRADAGRDRAADQRGTLERDGALDLDHILRRQGGVLGHDPAAGEDIHGVAARIARPQRAVGQGNERLALIDAQDGTPHGAVAAGAAHVDKGGHDVVPRREILDPLADPHHRAGGLMPQDERQSHADGAVGRREIGMANTARGDLHHDFAAPRRIHRDRLDDDGPVQLAAQHRAGGLRITHRFSSGVPQRP